MIFDLTWNTSAKSNLTRSQAGDLGWPHRKITALEKRAGEAGNRHRFDLDVTLRK
jgi:hypothetical protein